MDIKNMKEFEENSKDGVVLVDFYADWCGPCKMLLPVINEITQEYKDAKILKVNIDNNEELAAKFGVQSIPTLVYLKDANEVDRSMGFVAKDVIIEKLNKLAK